MFTVVCLILAAVALGFGMSKASLDHITPCAKTDVTKIQRKAFAYLDYLAKGSLRYRDVEKALIVSARFDIEYPAARVIVHDWIADRG